MLKIYDLETARLTILRREGGGTQAYPPAVLDGISQAFGRDLSPSEAVEQILASVREDGDQALRRWSRELDEVDLEEFLVPQTEFEAAYNQLPSSLADALEAAGDRIRAFHQQQPLPAWTTETLGGRLGQRFTPLQRIGAYIPGGSAPLPSSLLMSVIPAQVAGVDEILICTPPPVSTAVLAAAHLCGLSTLYQVGGAQAVAAMAFGTESIPKVDKIVGAGNIFVTLAKQQVYGQVGIDGLAGPTETMIIADSAANPVWVAADLLAQAEHDPMASCILLTPERSFAETVQKEANEQVVRLSRSEIIAESLAGRGGIVLTDSLETSVDIANEYAPEHLCLSVREPGALAADVRNAGGIFLGEQSFEVLGDYISGPSHVMPTGGSARFASPLNVLDFLKLTSWIELDGDTAAALSPLAAEMARAESLTAHAAAAELRVEQQDV